MGDGILTAQLHALQDLNPSIQHISVLYMLSSCQSPIACPVTLLQRMLLSELYLIMPQSKGQLNSGVLCSNLAGLRGRNTAWTESSVFTGDSFLGLHRRSSLCTFCAEPGYYLACSLSSLHTSNTQRNVTLCK